jgi:hypothetical protein
MEGMEVPGFARIPIMFGWKDSQAQTCLSQASNHHSDLTMSYKTWIVGGDSDLKLVNLINIWKINSAVHLIAELRSPAADRSCWKTWLVFELGKAKFCHQNSDGCYLVPVKPLRR